MKQEFFLFTCLMAPVAINAQTIGDAGRETTQVNVVDPVKKNPDIKSAAIDDERFELGVFGGLMSLEDFNTVSLIGLQANYHISSSWLVGLSYGRMGIPEAAFEEAVGGNFITDEADEFQYMSLTGAYELFEGRSFIGERKKLSTHLLIDFGVENIQFNREMQTGFVFGTTYKVVLNDWLTGDLRMRNHIANRTFDGEEKVTQNLELSFGLNVMF